MVQIECVGTAYVEVQTLVLDSVYMIAVHLVRHFVRD